ncbi:hypothetical protein GCM10027275_22650 [Rhabdobacter roseus]
MDSISPQRSYLHDSIVGYTEVKDIAFTKDSVMKLDIYYPTSATGNPSEVVILLHGGGWTTGDKFFLSPTVDQLKKARKNLTIVNVNYRLVADSVSLLSAQLSDIQASVEYLNAHADKYQIRTKNYRIAGVSAGGHLALTYAYGIDEGRNIGTVIGISAPTELSMQRLMDNSLWRNVQTLVGATYEQQTDKFIKASPLYLANFRSPRTFLLFGNRDELFSDKHGEYLVAKLKLLKVPYNYYLAPNETHDMSPRQVAETVFATF